MRARFLRQDERVFAKKVFGKTLPLDDILVTDLMGAGNEPSTAVSGPSNAPLPFVVPLPRFIYALNMGNEGFANCLTTSSKTGFVRELARIWQGPNCVASGRMPGPVAYEVGKPWSAFNSDQKAAVVEDWFRGGMRFDDPRDVYINGYVRRGIRN